tara:strand:+ start:249 stop:482 length:234 start_codon:yes stop_codon:yes gene_type:complete
MNRSYLKKRLEGYDTKDVPEIEHALEILNSSDSDEVSNDEIGDIWERVSKAIDHKYSDDDDHDAWQLETELAKAYKR